MTRPVPPQSRLALFFALSVLVISVGCGAPNASPSFGSQGNAAIALQQLPSVVVLATPRATVSGSPVTLTWQSYGASFVTIDHGIGKVSLSGAIQVSPMATTTYKITAEDAAGNAHSASVTATVVQPGTLTSSVNHIIFMLQENHSFDNYFGALNQYRASIGLPQDVNGLPPGASNPSADGQSVVDAFHLNTMCTENLPNAGFPLKVDFNRQNPYSSVGTMDGFVLTASQWAQKYGFHDVAGLRPMGYYDQTNLPYYYSLASNFAISDQWFSPVPGGTTYNREIFLAGGNAYSSSDLTLFELLENAGISWKIYVGPTGYTYLSYFPAFASQHKNKIVSASQFAVDVANGTLPSVAMIEKVDGLDEHPSSSPIPRGVRYAASFINTLMKSSSWNDSVFILTYDESGGFYDHVPPPLSISGDGRFPTRVGGRVPVTVISPFTRPHYVSHTPTDYTAIEKLIETRFGLPSLSHRDAAQMDMTEFFDFVNVPWLIPPALPLQPAGACYFDHLP